MINKETTGGPERVNLAGRWLPNIILNSNRLIVHTFLTTFVSPSSSLLHTNTSLHWGWGWNTSRVSTMAEMGPKFFFPLCILQFYFIRVISPYYNSEWCWHSGPGNTDGFIIVSLLFICQNLPDFTSHFSWLKTLKTL